MKNMIIDKEKWFIAQNGSKWAFCDWCGKLEEVEKIMANAKWLILNKKRKCPKCNKS